jgi:tetratricopeptide (TPR) repeat protein
MADYEARRYTEAAAAFSEAAAASPASATAWANLGAAQWMRADTAGAIVAWQRAARLAPRGTDARRQLQLHGLTGDLRSAIVPVTPNVAWLLLLGVTGVLSIAGAVWRWRQRAISNGALLGAAGIVAVSAALSVVAQRSADADGFVVIRRDVALRTEPVLAGEAGARARAGELALMREVRGTWRLLDVSAGRSGWVESEALRSLAAGDGRDVALAELRFATDAMAP